MKLFFYYNVLVGTHVLIYIFLIFAIMENYYEIVAP